MPVTLGGVASGMDTEGIIKKLVDVEKRPIRKLEREKQVYSIKKSALKELSKVLNKLDKSVKELYGFRASYEDKKAISSDESIVQASATKHASIGNRKLTVLELASTHRIISDPISKSEKIPSGKFRIEVNGEKELIKFRGGTIEKLRKKIEEAASNLVNVQSINTSGNKYVLSLESKVEGKKGELKITGDLKFLKRIGIAKGRKDGDKNIQKLVFDNKYFTSYIGKEKAPQQKGSLKVSSDGKAVTLDSVLWREYILPKSVKLKKNSVLEFNTKYTSPISKEKEEESLPFRIEMGPTITTIIKGITLKSYNVSRERPLDKKKPKPVVTNIFGVGVVIDKKGKRLEKVYQLQKDAKGKQEIPIGADFAGENVTKVIFYCNEGKVQFANTKISTPIKTKGLLEPKNVIAKAKDAKFKIDGVEVSREKNDNITDVMKGVTLNLKGANPKKTVNLKVDHDFDKAKKKINEFLENYNNYVKFHTELTKAAITKKAGDYKEAKSQHGIFVGDMTLMRLRNSLATAVGSAYPSRADKPIKLLSDAGISTGKVNASWEDIKKGHLQLEEEKLIDKIKKNPEGLKDLFGADTDGDNRVDSGFGFRMNFLIKPYIKSGKNIIASKIELQDDSIKRSNERIVKLERHVDAYEKKLKKKFANMEKVMSGAKAQRNWMNQQQKGGK